MTTSTGAYSFAGLVPGKTYTVREVLQQGWRATTAGGAATTAAAVAGKTTTASPFGDTNLVQISGTVFSDANGNGKKDAGEAGLAGYRVFVDLNGTGVYASNDPSVLTDASGNFTLLVASGTYKLDVVVPTGHKVTTPSSGSFGLTEPAGSVVTGELFGIK